MGENSVADQSRPHRRSLNQRGSALILSVMFVASVTITSLAIFDLAVVYNNQMALASNWVRERIILESFADFFVLAMKQRWCVDPNLATAASGSAACPFTSDYNLERLTTTDEFVSALAESGRTYGLALPTLIRIPNLSYDVPVSSIPNSHPLKALFSQPGMTVFDRVLIQVDRMDNKAESTSAQESYVRIRVTLNASRNLTIFRNTPQIWLERRLGIFRRDLSYFSLIVPRNLVLDGSAGGNGDIELSRSATGQGVRFESPIFVNQDVILPPSTPRNPATFGDLIVQGQGIVRRGSSPFTPASLGASVDRFWDQNLAADGIMAGISNDGRRDLGLDVFVGNLAVTPINSTEAKECIRLTRSAADLMVTRDSQMVVRSVAAPAPAGPSQAILKFDLGFTSSRFPGLNTYVPLVTPPAASPADKWLENFADPNTVFPNLFNLNHQRAGWYDPTPFMPTNGSTAVQMRWADAPAVVDPNRRPVVRLSITADGPTGRAQYFGMGAVGTVIKFFPLGTGVTNTQFQVHVETDYPNFATLQPPYLPTVQLRVVSFSSAASRPDHFTSLDIMVQGMDHGSFAAEDRRIPTLRLPSPAAGGGVLTDAQMMPVYDTVPDYSISAAQLAAAPNTFPAPSKDPDETRVPGRTNLARIKIVRPAASVAIAMDPITPIDGNWSNQDTSLRPQNLGPGIYPPSPQIQMNAAAPNDLQPRGYGEPGYMDWGDWHSRCAITDTQKASAFAIGGPDQSYLSNTRSSWNYANADPGIDTVNPPGYGGMPASSNVVINSTNQNEFHNQALMGTCTIDGTADHVAGFFVCDQFVIGPRGRPLTIVGSIITGRLQIDSSAYSNGVTFRSIFHPQSVVDMRTWGAPSAMLSMVREPPEACAFYPPLPPNNRDWPVWHPLLSIMAKSDAQSCNSVFYQRRTDNFRWTQVDPDCGFQPEDPANHRCKRRPYKFMMKLIGDQFLLK